MFALLGWTLWALAVSPSMAEATLKPVEWIDLMFATSKFPRFFGAPLHVSRSDRPKVTGLTVGVNFEEKHETPFGKILPVKCSCSPGKFSCEGAKVYDFNPEAFCDLQERRSSMGHGLDGLSFNSDYVVSFPDRNSPYTSYSFHFSQNMGERLPIDNTQVVLGLNKWDANGSLWPAPGLNQQMVYHGEFDDSKEPRCEKYLARDTAALTAMNQPFWSALNLPDYEAVYTVQDGRLYLTWRLKFDLKEKVGDDFYVWINARNCSQVIAAAPAKMNFYTRSLAESQHEQRKLFDERGIPLGNPELN